MKVEALRDTLLDLLKDELGTYTIAANPTPAIAILSTGQSLPNDRQVNGLEIIIRREPDRKVLPSYGGTITIKYWTVFLSQWEGSYTLSSAIQKISDRDLPIQIRSVPIEEQKGIKEQFNLRISDFDGD